MASNKKWGKKVEKSWEITQIKVRRTHHRTHHTTHKENPKPKKREKKHTLTSLSLSRGTGLHSLGQLCSGET
jgi:hypothetical protein